MSTDRKKTNLRKTRNLKQKKLAEIAPEQPKDMLDVVALRKMLDNLTESYQEAVASQEETEKRYFEKLDMLRVAPIEQRKELLVDTQLLNDESNDLDTKIKKQQNQMNEADELLQRFTKAQNAYDCAKDVLRDSENKLSAVKDQIEYFVQKYSYQY